MFKSKTLPKILVCVLFVALALGLIYLVSTGAAAETDYTKSPFIQLNNAIKVEKEKYYDGTKIMKLPSNVKDNDVISVINHPLYSDC